MAADESNNAGSNGAPCAYESPCQCISVFHAPSMSIGSNGQFNPFTPASESGVFLKLRQVSI